MFLNPKKLIQDGVIIPPAGADLEKHVQQNGVDISCDKVFEMITSQAPIISEDKVFSRKAKTQELQPIEIDGRQCFVLEEGKSYTFDSDWGVNISKDMCGWIVGRSSLNRQGVLIRSSWYDSGFQCENAGATIYCFRDIIIEKGARVAQIVLGSADAAGMYNGQYQFPGSIKL